MLSQFPAQELDQLATKEFVRAEIAGVHTEIAALRAEMQQVLNRMFFSLMGVAVGLGELIVAMARIS